MTCFDLHIHTALSACGENIMSPGKIIERARQTGLTTIALTDHNASGQVALACRLAGRQGLTVIPAIEVTSREEAHLLAYFPGLEELEEFQLLIDQNLPAMDNDPEIFGWQLIYDEHDKIIDVDEPLRQVGTDLTLDALTAAIHRLHGFSVPAHVFRHRYSLTSQLGFIDPESEFDAVEIRSKEWHRRRLRLGDWIEGFPAITGSDSHFLEDIGRCFLQSEKPASCLSELIRIIGGKRPRC